MPPRFSRCETPSSGLIGCLGVSTPGQGDSCVTVTHVVYCGLQRQRARNAPARRCTGWMPFRTCSNSMVRRCESFVCCTAQEEDARAARKSQRWVPRVGQTVRVPRLQGDAKVLSVAADGAVTLQMGFMKMSLPADELEPLRR